MNDPQESLIGAGKLRSCWPLLVLFHGNPAMFIHFFFHNCFHSTTPQLIWKQQRPCSLGTRRRLLLCSTEKKPLTSEKTASTLATEWFVSKPWSCILTWERTISCRRFLSTETRRGRVSLELPGCASTIVFWQCLLLSDSVYLFLLFFCVK